MAAKQSDLRRERVTRLEIHVVPHMRCKVELRHADCVRGIQGSLVDSHVWRPDPDKLPVGAEMQDAHVISKRQIAIWVAEARVEDVVPHLAVLLIRIVHVDPKRERLDLVDQR